MSEVQWTGDNLDEVIAFCAPVKAYKTVDGVCIERPEGAQWVHRGEWVVRNDEGRLSIWKRRPVSAGGEPLPADREQPEGHRQCAGCGGTGYFAAEVGPSRATGPCLQCGGTGRSSREQPEGTYEDGYQDGHTAGRQAAFRVREQPAGLRESLEEVVVELRKMATATGAPHKGRLWQLADCLAAAALPEEGS